MRRALLGALLLAGCDLRTENYCQTPCGTWIRDQDRVSCDELAPLEAAAVRELSPLFPGVNLCGRLSTYSLTTVDTPDGTFQAWFGVRVYGWQSCLTQEIHIAQMPGAWDRTSFVHELAHVAECPGANHGHEGWAEKDVTGAIDRANEAGR